MISHMVFLTKLGFENLKNQVTPSPFRKVRGGGMPKYDPTSYAGPQDHSGTRVAYIYTKILYTERNNKKYNGKKKS